MLLIFSQRINTGTTVLIPFILLFYFIVQTQNSMAMNKSFGEYSRDEKMQYLIMWFGETIHQIDTEVMEAALNATDSKSALWKIENHMAKKKFESKRFGNQLSR